MSFRQRDAVLIMTGEPSGDWAGAEVVNQINLEGSYRIFGVGGEYLDKEGVQLIGNIDDLTALGFAESIKRLGKWMEVWAKVREAVKVHKPKVALLVDAPEVNLPLARVLTEAGVKVVFYIGPQVWAWREHRLSLLKDRTDVVALILPFEKPIYDRADVKAVFVGHPILDRTPTGTGETIRQELGVGLDETLVALLPGSRLGELKRHAQPMIGAASKLKKAGVRSVLATPTNLQSSGLLGEFMSAGVIVPSKNLTARQVTRGSNCAIVASGTATLEATLERVPQIIIYKMDKLSYLAGKMFVKTPFIGLPNLVAGRKIVPELIQDEVTSEALYRGVQSLLEPFEQRRMREELGVVSQRLGTSGAARRVAHLVLERLL